MLERLGANECLRDPLFIHRSCDGSADAHEAARRLRNEQRIRLAGGAASKPAHD
jgi:hypothetical protein